MRKLSTATVGSLAAYLLIAPAAAQPAAPVDCSGEFQGSRSAGSVRLNLDCDFSRRGFTRPQARVLRRSPVRTVPADYYGGGPYYGGTSRPFLRNGNGYGTRFADPYDYDEEVFVERYSRPRPRIFVGTVYDEAPDDDWCPISWLFGRWYAFAVSDDW